jgi:hypothetical protein
MAVMGEVNHLARGSHSGEQPKGFLGAEIIESNVSIMSSAKKGAGVCARANS